MRNVLEIIPEKIDEFITWVAFAWITICSICSIGFSAESNSSNSLTPFEKAELKRLFELDISNLSKVLCSGCFRYDQEYWRNLASVHVIGPSDITNHGFANSVEALRAVPGMHVTRGLAMKILQSDA